MKNSRQLAVQVLQQVLADGRSLGTAIPEVLSSGVDAETRAHAQEMIYGVMRWHLRLRFILSRLMPKALKAKDMDVQITLMLGIYQLEFMRTPAYAVINETVKLAKLLKKQWAGSLINAVLRNYQRQSEQLAKDIEQNPEAQTAHPAWMVEQVKKDWPDSWQDILAQNNARAPMTLRVNLQQSSREAYFKELEAVGIEADIAPHTAAGIILRSAVAVEQLPGFNNGRVSVQDGAPQLAAGLLGAKEGERVLDACSAPGGKTAAILESQPSLAQMIALDVSEKRLVQVKETLARLKLKAKCHAVDASTVDRWWQGEPFDRILLDVPCSGTGVIRRNPDIKFHRQREDIQALELQQQAILEAAWQVLTSGGMLLYATCSIIRDENDRQLSRFLEKHEDATEIPIQQSWGHPLTVGRQILPGEDNMDGFYYALLTKK